MTDRPAPPPTSALVLDVGNRRVMGSLVDYRSSRLARFAATPRHIDTDLSLTFAELRAAVGHPPTDTPVAVVAELEAAIGPAAETLAHAQQVANDDQTTMIASRGADQAVATELVPVDAIIEAAAGAGLELDRIEAAETAELSANRLPGSRSFRSIIVDPSLYNTQGIGPEELAPTIGCALNLLHQVDFGDLRLQVAQIIAPDGLSSPSLGWNLAPMAAPATIGSHELQAIRRLKRSAAVLFGLLVVTVIALLIVS